MSVACLLSVYICELLFIYNCTSHRFKMAGEYTHTHTPVHPAWGLAYGCLCRLQMPVTNFNSWPCRQRLTNCNCCSTHTCVYVCVWCVWCVLTRLGVSEHLPQRAPQNGNRPLSSALPEKYATHCHRQEPVHF